MFVAMVVHEYGANGYASTTDVFREVYINFVSQYLGDVTEEGRELIEAAALVGEYETACQEYFCDKNVSETIYTDTVTLVET